jgi:hypothetical protein
MVTNAAEETSAWLEEAGLKIVAAEEKTVVATRN